ncbi:hypothetical protein [Plebeiibacterium marinum]|uniref:Anti-sigma factor n=1 Tax=Plebeiibacterium marinum TaxID=2992111 RepID=A0AAE3SIR9_9BACT|nr:hypothetical protein [Plebeiobacterium marinum]MCW3804965.1 hypothetical protein [Plebeiobacterium marinum]
MENNFNKYIKNNRESFNDLTPPANMWERISDNIPAKKDHSHKKLIFSISSAAAFLTVTLLAYHFLVRAPYSKPQSFYSEIQETERYYNNILANKKETIYKLTGNTPEIKQDIETELALLDSAMVELKNDLKDGISNTEVVEAMVQNYRMKLKILEDILKYLKPKEEKHSYDISNI